MRVLIVSPYPVTPPLHGGRVRVLGIASGLARAGAEVAVLCPWVPWNRLHAQPEPGLECFSHVFCANLLPALAHWLAPPLVLLSFQPRSVGLRRRLARFREFDVFQFEFCAHAHAMDLAPPGAKVVYSAHNVEVDFLSAEGDRYLLKRAARSRIEQIERFAIERSDLVLACSSADSARLRELYGAPRRLAVITNGFDASWLSFRGAETRDEARAALGLAPDDRAIVFVGGDAHHNREAVDFLVRAVLPRLPEDARLLVAGRSARMGEHSHPRFRRMGFVADLRPLFAAADVAVNPVTFGSGSNVKLAEYLAAGLPVLTTTFGLRGFPQAGHPALRVVERDGFVGALRGPLPRAARDGASLSDVTWDAIGRRVYALYDELCGGDRQAQPARTPATTH